MQIVALLASSVGLLLSVVICAALVEISHQIGELRAVLNLQDTAIPMSLPDAKLSAADVGLGILTHAPHAIVVFLSPRCGTCLSIADTFRGGTPDTVWFVVPGDDDSEVLRVALADSSSQVIPDNTGAIAEGVGINVTPAVLTLQYGELLRVQAVSSARQVLSMVPIVPRAQLGAESRDRASGAGTPIAQRVGRV